MDHSDKHLLAKIGQYVLLANSENQVLLLQRSGSGVWSLPGGRLNKNELDCKQALDREISEETGLSILNLQPFDVCLIQDPYQIKYCVFFTASIEDLSVLKLSSEHISSKWINSSDLPTITIDDEPKVRQILDRYFDSFKI